jgi:hypothetical protein
MKTHPLLSELLTLTAYYLREVIFDYSPLLHEDNLYEEV